MVSLGSLMRSLPRSSHLLLGLVMLGGGSCGKPDPGETKPAASPEVQLKGVDTSPLTPRERREWAAQVSELLAPCADVPVSIAQCVKENRSCKACLPAAQMLMKQVQAGKSKKDREEAFHARFDTNKLKTIVTDGSPEMGPPDAPVTIVEWADFECPFCKAVSPVLDDITKRFPGQVRLVYKFYPLQAHAHGEIAARAGAAAINQGKFWEMHHALFENQEHLEAPDLERYAKQLNLDVGKFRSDLGSNELKERIDKDKSQADQLGLDGTPFIFINGRYVNLNYITGTEDLVDWVKLDLELLGKTPNMVKPAGTTMPVATGAPPAPAGSGSASAPAASGSAAPDAKAPKK